MALPKIELPTYVLRLPSSDQEVVIRPFTVKEEKLLLMAADSGDENYIIDTTKQVINNCLLTEGIDIDKLPFFDVDYLFIALRAKSIGSSIEMQFTCNATTPDGETCKNVFYENIDISNATVDKDESIGTKIELSNRLIIKMRYPNYATMKILSSDAAAIDKKVDIIAACIEYIADGDEVHSYKDYSHQELVQFIEGLTEEYFEKLAVFVENFPTFSIKQVAQCTKCGFNHQIKYSDYTAFFQ